MNTNQKRLKVSIQIVNFIILLLDNLMRRSLESISFTSDKDKIIGDVSFSSEPIIEAEPEEQTL